MKLKDRRKAKKRELKRKRVDEELSKDIPNTWSGGIPRSREVLLAFGQNGIINRDDFYEEWDMWELSVRE